MKRLLCILLGSITFASAQNNADLKKEIVPPKAKKIAKNLEFHGDVRVDNYYWMNNRDDAEVIDYLNQENEYNRRF